VLAYESLKGWRIKCIQAYLNGLRLRHAELSVDVERLAPVDARCLMSLRMQNGLCDAIQCLGPEVQRFDLPREPRHLFKALAGLVEMTVTHVRFRDSAQ
jgi:hypothetical protein